MSYCLECYNSRRRAWLLVSDNAVKVRSANHRAKIKRKYGLSPEEYQDLLNSQLGLCAICEEREAVNLAVDHNHSTGKVRGLLCKPCNLGLGNFKDNPAVLIKAAEYLWKDRYG